eukprot:8212941-Alexandrium_andersonii.AAC.1
MSKSSRSWLLRSRTFTSIRRLACFADCEAAGSSSATKEMPSPSSRGVAKKSNCISTAKLPPSSCPGR